MFIVSAKRLKSWDHTNTIQDEGAILKILKTQENPMKNVLENPTISRCVFRAVSNI